MKRKIIAVIALVICMSFATASCSVLQLNEKRRGESTVAEITYVADNGDTIKRIITRLQLIQAVNQTMNQYYSYNQSYGMAIPPIAEVVEDTLDYLCETQLVIAYGIDYLSKVKAGVINDAGEWTGDKQYALVAVNQQNNNGVYDKVNYDGDVSGLTSENPFGAHSLLSYAEFDKVIKNANTQYESLFEDYLDTVEAEQKAREDSKNSDDDDVDDADEDEITLSARPVKIDSSEEEFEYNSIPESLTKRYPDNYEEFTGIADNSDTQDKKNRLDAWKRTEKALEKAYIDYEYLLNSALDSMLIYEFKRMLTSYDLVDGGDIDAYFQKIVDENKEAQKKLDDYTSALDSSYTGIFYHKATSGYYYVKNIVISFDAITKAAVDSLMTQYKEPEKDEGFLSILNKWALDVKVNLSNIFYDPDDGTTLYYQYDPDAKDGPKNTLEFDEDEEAEIAALKSQIDLWVNGDEVNEPLSKSNINNNIIEKISEKVEPDGNGGYTLKSGVSEKYLFMLSAALDTETAYTVIDLDVNILFAFYKAHMGKVEEANDNTLTYTKSILEAFDVWFYALNDDGETSFNAEKDYLSYIDREGYSEVFLQLADDLYTKGGGGADNTVGNYYYTDEVGTKTYWAVSQFGYHILMITYVPFSNAAVGDSGVDNQAEGTLSYDHILDYYKLDKNTVEQYIKDILQEERDNFNYYKEQTKIKNLTDNSNKASFKKIEKKYKDLKKAE
ncbi:MAG: hypothetical protein LBQ27_01025 [Clostridiales bacterium]|jgi:hypothetical protein|nr:hypothetical protein [Clostridiales bacterium]